MNKDSLTILKVSLAMVFVWFGLLKFFDVSPVANIIASAYPWLMEIRIFYVLLALFEIGLSIGILVPKISKIIAALMILHLLGATFGVLFSEQAFVGGFPYLSVVGEFVVKNFVLIAGAFIIAKNKDGFKS